MHRTSIGTLYPHQRDALKRLKNGSILWGGVGTGKSITAVAYYLEKEAPKDVIVITTAKKRDSLEWDEEFARIGLFRNKPNIDGGEGFPATTTLVIDSWNNIQKYQNRYGAFFIFDEQRLVGSGKWVKSFIKLSRRNHWILLSATPGDTWLDYVPVFVANGFYANSTEFKREHVVYKSWSKFPQVDHFTGLGRLLRQRKQLLVEMPYLQHTIRHVKEIHVDHDKDLYRKVEKRKWHVYEERPLQNVGELFLVMRRVANSDLSRLSAVRSLMQSHPRLIVFYNFDYELELLRTLCDGGTEQWETNLDASTEPSASPASLLMENCKLGSTASTAERLTRRQKGVITNSTTSIRSGDWSLQKKKPNQDQDQSCLFEDNSQTVNAETGTKTSLERPGCSSIVRNDLIGTGISIVTKSGATSIPIAEWNGHKHEPIPKTERWVYLVQYMAGAEGWNCITTDAMCFYSLPYSYKLFEQAKGRIDRINTPYIDLWYYVLCGDSSIDRAVKKALDEKRSFNESAYYRS